MIEIDETLQLLPYRRSGFHARQSNRRAHFFRGDHSRTVVAGFWAVTQMRDRSKSRAKARVSYLGERLPQVESCAPMHSAGFRPRLRYIHHFRKRAESRHYGLRAIVAKGKTVRRCAKNPLHRTIDAPNFAPYHLLGHFPCNNSPRRRINH